MLAGMADTNGLGYKGGALVFNRLSNARGKAGSGKAFAGRRPSAVRPVGVFFFEVVGEEGGMLRHASDHVENRLNFISFRTLAWIVCTDRRF